MLRLGLTAEELLNEADGATRRSKPKAKQEER